MSRGSSGHRWKVGDVPNPRGMPKGHVSLASRMREHMETHGGPEGLLDIAISIAKGIPMVRLRDDKGMPLLAPPAREGTGDGIARPVPITMTEVDEATVHEIVWITTAERLQALTWIANTVGYKAPSESIIEVNQNQTYRLEYDTSSLSEEELDAYLALGEKLNRQRLGTGEDESIDADSVDISPGKVVK